MLEYLYNFNVQIVPNHVYLKRQCQKIKLNEIILRENKEILIFFIKFDHTVNQLATWSEILKKETSRKIFRGQTLL